MGFFVVVLKDPSQSSVPSIYIILPGLGTSLSMLISGISGSYLSEKAELKKKRDEINKAMGIIENDIIKEELDLTEQEEELKRAMLSKINLKIRKLEAKKRIIKKTIHEKAYNFAGIFVALVNGIAPLLGGLIPLIPFACANIADFLTFITSFLIIFLCIVLLGILLGRISNESIIKNILQMLFAFIATMTVVIIFLG